MERGKRERESDPNTEQSKGRKEERIEKGKKAVPKWKVRRRTHKSKAQFLPSLLLGSSSNQTQQTHNKKKERDAHRLVVDKKEGEQSHGKMDGWDAHCLVSHTNTHCILHWKGEHE